jgi:hypothetical protein
MSLSLISLGGGLYEFVVVDPAWPRRPDIIQPALGGLSRKRFWIPAHTGLELLLLASLFVAWSDADIRYWLLLAVASHVVMRIWSAFYFIPIALRFERMGAGDITESIARSWTRLSLLRLPLDLVTCAAMLAALVVAAQ